MSLLVMTTLSTRAEWTISMIRSSRAIRESVYGRDSSTSPQLNLHPSRVVPGKVIRRVLNVDLLEIIPLSGSKYRPEVPLRVRKVIERHFLSSMSASTMRSKINSIGPGSLNWWWYGQFQFRQLSQCFQ